MTLTDADVAVLRAEREQRLRRPRPYPRAPAPSRSSSPLPSHSPSRSPSPSPPPPSARVTHPRAQSTPVRRVQGDADDGVIDETVLVQDSNSPASVHPEEPTTAAAVEASEATTSTGKRAKPLQGQKGETAAGKAAPQTVVITPTFNALRTVADVGRFLRLVPIHSFLTTVFAGSRLILLQHMLTHMPAFNYMGRRQGDEQAFDWVMRQVGIDVDTAQLQITEVLMNGRLYPLVSGKEREQATAAAHCVLNWYLESLDVPQDFTNVYLEEIQKEAEAKAKAKAVAEAKQRARLMGRTEDSTIISSDED